VYELHGVWNKYDVAVQDGRVRRHVAGVPVSHEVDLVLLAVPPGDPDVPAARAGNEPAGLSHQLAGEVESRPCVAARDLSTPEHIDKHAPETHE